MAEKKSDNKENIVIYSGRDDMYEFLNNVIQDAQAAGSIVQIITIFPGMEIEEGAEGGPVIKGCQPKAEVCPKGHR